MKRQAERTVIIEECLGRASDLVGLVDYAKDAIVSKTILDRPAGTITLFAFDQGQRLSEHTSSYDAVVQVLEGQASITIGPRQSMVSAGQVIVMPAGVPHAVEASQRFKMLLTMIKGRSDAR